MVSSLMSENIHKKGVGNAPKSHLLENIPKTKEGRIKEMLESLNLQSIESWTQQQQQSARAPIMEYQHLFALTLNEFGVSSTWHQIR